MQNNTLIQLSSLHKMDMPQLKQLWKNLLPDKSMKNSRDYFISRLSYRIQELAQGGLSDKAQQQMVRLQKQRTQQKTPKQPLPPIGTKLIRKYKGIEHQVTLVKNGFEYQGQKYKSLSKVARVITGTQWNGFTFFGLKKKGE
jgi:hypothetical protein